MVLEQYESARQSYREAVRREPANNTYRTGALNAELAERRSKTVAGKLRRTFHNIKRRMGG